MGVFVLDDADLRIGTSAAPSTALSPYIRSVTISYSAEIQDKTAMGSSGRRRIAGLKDGSVALEFNQDFAADKVDEILWPMVGSTNKWISIKPHSSAVGAGNPRFYGDFVLPDYSPLSGAIGDLATVSVTFQCDGVISRSTSAT